MAVRLLLLVAICSWVVVSGELCQFPSDHPIQILESEVAVPVEEMENNRVYIYTDQFGNCSGCVRSLRFCYKPNMNELMTIEIGNNGDGLSASHIVTVDSTNDMTNCAERYSLNHFYCCVEQMLTEPFVVGHKNWHYRLRFGNVASLLLRHQNETVAGRQEGLNGAVYKPLFYFTIDPDDDDCSNISSTTPSSTTPAATASEGTTEGTTESTTEGTTESSTTAGDMSTVSTTTSTSSPVTTPPPSSDPTDPTAPSTTGSTTTTTTEPGVVTAAQSGSSSDLGSVAGGIAVVLVIVLLLIVGAVVGIMCLKKKQNKRKVVVSRARGEAGGISNVVYGAAGAEKMVVSSASPNSNTYAEKTKTDGKHQYECIEDLPSKTENVPTPYTYADALPQSQVEYLSYAAVGAEANAGKRPSLHYEVDSIYEAPASSEHGLYAQFEKIKIATIPRNTIEATECLGSGQFGTVNRGVWQSPSSTMEVAIKTLNSTAMEVDRVKFLQEGAIMGQFKHPNVVRLHGIVRDKETVLLVIELLGKDDLREHLLTLRPGEGEMVDPGMPHTLLSYCRQVASGLLYLSKKGFVHRDIAARNILLSEDQETCKIADFGMSRDLADETYYISSGGKIPVKWTAPEALHYKKYSTASDVWSFGCLMYEIWSLGHKPLEGYTNVQAIKMVDGGQRLAPPPGCPRAIYKLMINCWNPVTSERPSSDSLSQSLARPDPTLLKWEASDKPAGVPEALVLGAPLDSASLLYPDLQRVYLPPDLTDSDYEEPS